MRIILVILALVATACVVYRPDTPQPGRHTFDVNAEYSHSAPNDPIVFPDEPGASHAHQFFCVEPGDPVGHPNTCANSAVNSSGYWFPAALRVDGSEIIPDGTPHDMRAYYRSRGQEGLVFPFPQGFRMISDDAVIEQTPSGQWALRVDFPNCINHLDSPDHRSHTVLSPEDGGPCPPSHRLTVPRITMRVLYPEKPDRWSSGDASTLHGDFLNGWDETAIAQLTNGCLNIGRDYLDNAESCTIGEPLDSFTWDIP